METEKGGKRSSFSNPVITLALPEEKGNPDLDTGLRRPAV